MKLNRLACLFIVVFIVTGCGGVENAKSLSVEDTQPVHHQNEVDQAKRILLSMEEITEVKGVQYDHLLFLSAKVKQFDRLKLNHVRQEAFKKVKEEFPKSKVHISTDKKVYMELEELEVKLVNKKISEKDLKKQLMKIEDDMKG